MRYVQIKSCSDVKIVYKIKKVMSSICTDLQIKGQTIQMPRKTNTTGQTTIYKKITQKTDDRQTDTPLNINNINTLLH